MMTPKAGKGQGQSGSLAQQAGIVLVIRVAQDVMGKGSSSPLETSMISVGGRSPKCTRMFHSPGHPVLAHRFQIGSIDEGANVKLKLGQVEGIWFWPMHVWLRGHLG